MMAPIRESVIKMSEDLVERILKREGKYHPRLGAEYYPVYNNSQRVPVIEAYAIANLNEETKHGNYLAPHTYSARLYCEMIGDSPSPVTSWVNHPYKAIIEINKYLVDGSRSSERRNFFLPLLELTTVHEMDHHKFTLGTMTQLYDLGNRIANKFTDIDYPVNIDLSADFLKKYYGFVEKIYDEIEDKMELSAFATEMYTLLDWLKEKSYDIKYIAYIFEHNFSNSVNSRPGYKLVASELFGNFDPNHWMYQKLLKLMKDPYEFSKDKDSIEEMMNYLEKKREELYNSCAIKVKRETDFLSKEFDILKEEIFRK